MSTVHSAVILGEHSEIGGYLSLRLIKEGWRVRGWSRGDSTGYVSYPWDLCIVAIGQVHPVGMWWEQDDKEWESAIESNLLLPIRLLRQIWPHRKQSCSVCFLAGANPNKYMEGYSAYATGKMGLLKAVEFLDAESVDERIFALGPGTILTKIHNATRKADWPNEVLKREEDQDTTAKMDRVFQCLKWCMSQPKEVVGGRNICASDPWDKVDLGQWLKANPKLYKLRRYE